MIAPAWSAALEVGIDHPLIGHLRCDDWPLFIGVHDLMHLEQLHGLRAAHA